jgi:hypothetical protein
MPSLILKTMLTLGLFAAIALAQTGLAGLGQMFSTGTVPSRQSPALGEPNETQQLAATWQ